MPSFKKQKYICAMCRKIKDLNGNKRCFLCEKKMEAQMERNKEYHIQLRKSMGLS